MLVIIDYGLGNLGSIQNMLKKIGVKSFITSDIKEIESASKLILPGVGSFDFAMSQLKDLGLIELLNHKVLVEKTPILGICLGVQLFTTKSEEGQLQGLNWIEAETLKFQFSNENSLLKIPHMGWNDVTQLKESRLFKDMPDESRFYFVHSFYLKPKNNENSLLNCNYGLDFSCALEKDNIVGVQFHPEKSHKFGMQLLRNFVENY